MRHQSLDIYNATPHESDRPRPGVAISILELQVNFLRAQPHEWEFHFILANAYHEDSSPELDGMDGRRQAALDARALQRNSESHPCACNDGFGGFFGRDPPDVMCPDACNELFCKLQPPLVNVRDDNRFCPRSTAAQQRDQSDRTSPTDQDGVSQPDI